MVTPEIPVEPPASAWQFPCDAKSHAAAAKGGELVAVGGDLEPGTLLAAYRCGLFPMPVGKRLAWWSPDPRGVVPLDGLVVSRSLRMSCRRYEVRFDTAFGEVIAACADPSRPGGWIDRNVRVAYTRLHELGWAHSVEAWDEAGELAGGLYGVLVGGLFAGESMFHRGRDASKVALVALVKALRAGGARLLDVQWVTPHLASLGAVPVSRERYLSLLQEALAVPQVRLVLPGR
ncbi:MAG: leucyl/phenylalanyl-tRNA--protein transferase [Acidimicrobiales bacterium]